MSKHTELSNAKAKALEGAIGQIQKEYGKEAIMDMSEGPRDIESISTQSLALDIALGIGGIPKGRLIEIYGPESSGKTTLCYHLMAAVQKEGGVAAFIDTEHAMDAKYAASVGVDVDKLIISQPNYGEEGLSIAELLTSSGAVDLIVIDSVAALTPKAELEGNISDANVGLQARMMSKACRMLSGKANNSGTTIVFTNQLREKIGVMFGSPETQPGGRALKFFSSVRLDIRRIETIKDKTSASVANRVRVKVVKNKVAPPFTQAEFDIVFGEGIDRYGILLDYAIEPEIDLISKGGAFYTFPDGTKQQGKINAKNYLKENSELAEEIDTKIRKHYLTPTGESEEVEEASGTDDSSSEEAKVQEKAELKVEEEVPAE